MITFAITILYNLILIKLEGWKNYKSFYTMKHRSYGLTLFIWCYNSWGVYWIINDIFKMNDLL
jgi:hypothetical protein